jgi:hypothetical protein
MRENFSKMYLHGNAHNRSTPRQFIKIPYFLFLSIVDCFYLEELVRNDHDLITKNYLAEIISLKVN